MTAQTQPEALALADMLSSGRAGNTLTVQHYYKAADVMRRLHAEVEQLRADLAKANDAAAKGDAARADAGGMEMRIADLERQLAARAPLSDEQIAGLDNYVRGTVHGRFARAKAFTRAIERARGIGEKTS